MISRPTSSTPKERVVFPRLLYSNSRRSQTYCRHSQTFCRRSQVIPGLSAALPGLSQVLPSAPKLLSGAPRCSQIYHNPSHGTPGPVIRDSSDSDGEQEFPPRVWYFPETDASKFTVHILADTTGGFQWLKYILLISSFICCCRKLPMCCCTILDIVPITQWSSLSLLSIPSTTSSFSSSSLSQSCLLLDIPKLFRLSQI